MRMKTKRRRRLGATFLEYDEDGSLALARALHRMESLEAEDSAAMPVQDLNGSWYLQLTPRGPHTFTEIRGPMRIEVSPPKLRISGDVYVRKPVGPGPVEVLTPITAQPLLFGTNWYPQLPLREYSWYFRSLGATYDAGKLVFKFERHLWNRTTQEFINQENSGIDQGFIELQCNAGEVVTHPLLPAPALRIAGTAQVGGETHDAVATKSSPFYRGCAVEVDVMKNRSFPLSATTLAGATLDFAKVYATAGMECAVTLDQTNLPEDAELSTIELQTAFATNRRPRTDDAWRLWLLVGSSQGSLFGLMFDDDEPFREGTAGFFDPTLSEDPFIHSSARNKKLGEVPAAFLRTLVHEAGHAFNLFHPKHDVHQVPIGTTIMNQTGDVMGFASEQNPYPGNITFGFDDHNRSSLVHSPDPQVTPGWKRFGWGHGSLANGAAEPVDAAGLLRDASTPSEITLALQVPENVFRGEFVAAQFTVTNRGASPRAITSAINLSQGDLRILLKPPAEELSDVRDVIIACGDRSFVTLAAGASMTGSAQIFYTNVGFTFRQTGRYYLSAELDLGDGTGAVARSNLAPVVVRAPQTREEEQIASLSLKTNVGRAFAFGDYGTDQEARLALERLATVHGASRTGQAAALTLANAEGRELRDLYSGRTLRPANMAGARSRIRAAAATVPAGDAKALVRLAVAVAAPTEADAPVLDLAAEHLRTGGAEPAADAIPKATRAARGRAKGRKGKPAPRRRVAYAAGVTEALDLLQDMRRTFARRK
jgi:hypothetical protein